MNELERMCAEVRPPERQAVDEGRRRLLAAAHDTGSVATRRSWMPPPGVRLAAVGALTAATVAGVAVAQHVGHPGEKVSPRQTVPTVRTGPIVNAADLLDRAATAAETDPSAPRPDQWIFTEDKQHFPKIGTRVVTPKTPLVTFVSKTWRRVDGKQEADVQEKPMGDGKLRLVDIATGGSTGRENAGWKHDYPALAAMPSDPKALPAWVASKGELDLGQSAKGRAATLSEVYATILRNGTAPPKAEAVIFRAIERLPGVVLKKGVVDLAGRKAIAVGLAGDDYLQKQILLDPTTYHYLGERIVATKDHTEHATDGTWVMKKGSIENLQVRTSSGIVDRPGQIP